jgi:myotubularin-related protein 6/7/8
MDQIRIPKVENVECWRQGQSVVGDLILAPHHITFHYSYNPPPKDAQNQSPPKATRQTWITYPMIGHCVFKPSIRQSSIRLRCRDFTFISFMFEDESEAKAVFETIRALTCRLGTVDKLYAFTYQPKHSERVFQSWSLYDPVKEFERMGVSSHNDASNWRISKINATYDYSPTYPAVICVPKVISDNTLKYAASFRSKSRIPALSYLHPINNCTITRSSQPLVGLRAARSPQDEKLVAAIFESTKPKPKGISSSPAPSSHNRTNSLPPSTEDSAQMEPIDLAALDISDESLTTNDAPEVKVYGAQQANLIVDARPRVNAIANHLTGHGSERMDGYKSARMAYLDIDNIHVMRRSLQSVVDVLKDTDIVLSTAERPTIDRSALNNSKWLVYLNRLLTGARQIAYTVAVQHSHVLIHCSDGWDRTSQLSALAQLCLDPFYRTIDGFIVLIEKDWLAFGHMFRWRSGLLSHQDWFETVNDRGGLRENPDSGAETPDRSENAFEKTLGHVQNLLRRKVEPEDSEGDSEGSPSKPRKGNNHDKMATEVKETSPIFHQFLDAVYQLLRQYPTRFEFNERFLRRLLYHLYSCQYGTFLYNSEKERVDSKAKERTRSVWDYFLSQRQQFTNSKYDPVIDDNNKDRTRLLLPNTTDIRWWYEVFNRSDEEMNGNSSVPLSFASGADTSIDSSTDRLASSIDTTTTSSFMAVPPTDSAPSSSQERSGPASSITTNTSRIGDWASSLAADISASNPLSLLSRPSAATQSPSSKANITAKSSNTPSSSSLSAAKDDSSDAFSGVTLANIVGNSGGTNSLTKTQWMSGNRGKTSPSLEVEME